MNKKLEARKLRNAPFSERELEVIALVVEGLSTKEISDKMLITESTVKFHLGSIYTLTGLKTRSRFMANFYKTGNYYPPGFQAQTQQGEQNAEG